MKQQDPPAAAANAPRVDPATLDFLRWIAERTATYHEALEVWQTTCPRQSTWEDSFHEGLVRVQRLAGSNQSIVVLTPLGRSILGGSA